MEIFKSPRKKTFVRRTEQPNSSSTSTTTTTTTTTNSSTSSSSVTHTNKSAGSNADDDTRKKDTTTKDSSSEPKEKAQKLELKFTTFAPARAKSFEENDEEYEEEPVILKVRKTALTPVKADIIRLRRCIVRRSPRKRAATPLSAQLMELRKKQKRKSAMLHLSPHRYSTNPNPTPSPIKGFGNPRFLSRESISKPSRVGVGTGSGSSEDKNSNAPVLTSVSEVGESPAAVKKSNERTRSRRQLSF